MENKLDIDVRNADALGLSYGQYKALHYDPYGNPAKKQEHRVSDKICPVCGNYVFWPQRKYCSDECRNKAHDIMKQERYYSKKKQYDKDGEQDADS